MAWIKVKTDPGGGYVYVDQDSIIMVEPRDGNCIMVLRSGDKVLVYEKAEDLFEEMPTSYYGGVLTGSGKVGNA